MNKQSEPLPYLLPTPKHYASRGDGAYRLNLDHCAMYVAPELAQAASVTRSELVSIGCRRVTDAAEEASADIAILGVRQIPPAYRERLKQQRFPEQSYVLLIEADRIAVYAEQWQGALYGVATLVQLVEQLGADHDLPQLEMVDGPDVEKRIISPTLTWYAGFARAGFGTQLWDGDRWQGFIDWCFRHKVNALNIVMYGFWPFEFPAYPETVLRDIKVQTWSAEIGDWVEVSYTHPNLRKPFLESMIRYANDRGIEIYAYIGMNSYSGGYPVVHPESRTVLSQALKDKGHVNNYDFMCTSRPEVRRYLIESVKRIEALGFDGLVFEESEEVQWFCQCDACQSKYGHLPPNEAKHTVTIDLLREYERVLNPDTLIGIRWLREPPIVKDEAVLRAWAEKLPERVKLFWAPGLEDDDKEFLKWVKIFGKERIWSRNCEGSGFAASLGRIPYLIPDTFPDTLKNYAFQHLWNDISQFQGAANMGCTAINGYGFEWYGHEHYFMATAQYGWDCWRFDHDAYLAHASRHLFGERNGSRYEQLIRMLPCIHETQICETLPSFPFMPNKYVGAAGRRYLEGSADAVDQSLQLLQAILHTPDLSQVERECAEATLVMTRRMKEIIWAGLYYNRYLEERDASGRTEVLRQLADRALHHAEEDYRLIKEHYFDTKDHTWTGVSIGEYYIPQVINEYKKRFHADLGDATYEPDPELDYIVGGESLPWEWLLEWGPKIAEAKPTAALRTPGEEAS